MLSSEDLALLEQEGLTLAQAARILPSRVAGKRVHVATLWRWSLKGTRHGVHLRVVRVGGHMYTTRTWLKDFIDDGTSEAPGTIGVREKLGTEARPPRAVIPQIRTAAQRRRDAEYASKKLDELGI